MHADGARRLDLPAVEGEIGAAKDLGLVGARDDPERRDADSEGRHPDEAGDAEQACDVAQGRAAAEIQEVDHQQVGHAAQERGVAVGGKPQGQEAGELGARRQPAEHGAEEEAAQGERQRGAGGEQQRAAPAAGAEAEKGEGAHADPIPVWSRAISSAGSGPP